MKQRMNSLRCVCTVFIMAVLCTATVSAADTDLNTRLATAKAGERVVLSQNETLTQDATVPVGVTLYIPYDQTDDLDGVLDGTSKNASMDKISEDIYRTLTIHSGVTLTVNGTLTVGSVMSYPAMNGYQGHTSGAHGKIANHGAIVIGDGGKLNSFGIVDGSGTVSAQSGATITEPLIVVDFVGGANTYDLYFDHQTPFRHWAIQNIQNTLTLNAGAEFLVSCNLYASGAYNKTNVPFFAQNGLFRLKPGTSLIRTFDPNKHTDENPDLGLTTYTISGGMDVQAMKMLIQGVEVSTDSVDFAIPYNVHMVFEKGDYAVQRRLKLMPGSSLTIAEDATLTVEGKAFTVGSGETMAPALFVHNGLKQEDMSKKVYPSSAVLKKAGFSQSGMLLVDGYLVVDSGGVFGGIIQSGGSTGVVTLNPGAQLTTPRLQDGTRASYDNSTAICALQTRAYLNEQITELSPGTSYNAVGGTSWTLPSYDVTYMTTATKAEYEAAKQITDKNDLRYVDKIDENTYHKWKTETVTIQQPMTGIWTVGNAHVGEVPEPPARFSDVSADAWYYADVMYMAEKGLMKGTAATTFEPNTSMTRAMFLTTLHRMSGNATADTAGSTWYRAAVDWAKSENISDGTDLNRKISREEMTTILFRYAKVNGTAPTGAWAVQLTYADTHMISEWAVESAMYAQINGIIKGREGNRFDPQGTATRAEVAAVLHRMGK
ncbi:MAG: S-layer homology domain-containing protein [Evtepia sp.]